MLKNEPVNTEMRLPDTSSSRSACKFVMASGIVSIWFPARSSVMHRSSRNKTSGNSGSLLYLTRTARRYLRSWRSDGNRVNWLDVKSNSSRYGLYLFTTLTKLSASSSMLQYLQGWRTWDPLAARYNRTWSPLPAGHINLQNDTMIKKGSAYPRFSLYVVRQSSNRSRKTSSRIVICFQRQSSTGACSKCYVFGNTGIL